MINNQRKLCGNGFKTRQSDQNRFAGKKHLTKLTQYYNCTIQIRNDD